MITALLLTAFAVTPFAPAQAQGADPKVPIKVAQTSLPVTVGVPLGESANVTDPARLVLLDPAGKPVPVQTRVLARWRGAATNTGAAIKWVLVDFKPATAGTYTLSSAGNAPAAGGVTTSDLGTSLRVTSSRVTLDFAKGGASLVTSFRLDGAEQLKAPLTIEGALPRGAVVALVNSSDTLTVSETGMLKVGDTVRFAHTAALIWAANAGDNAFFSINQTMQGNRTYRLEEGTPRQEDVLVSTAENGKLTVSGALRYAHAAGTPVRDLTAEQETAVIKSISGQVVTFTAPLRQQHVISDSFSVADVAPASAFATIERTAVEEQGALRTVILQQGHFTSSAFGGNVVDPSLKFTVRYYVYADQPFVRVRFQLMNEGPFGFGAWRKQSGVFSQHLLIRRITASVPTVTAGSGGVLIVDREDAYTRSKARWAGPTVTAGAMELSVPEFAENYPKGVAGDASGLRFDVMPDRGFDYVFDGARAKTTDFYLGKQTAMAMGLTDQLPGVVDPAYIATTGAVRPLFVERRNWTQVFSGDAEMAEAATRAERWLAVGYDVGSSDENWRIPATSIYEYRWRDESGANLGWRNFGDFAWGDGYCNQHYDIPYVLMREFARTGDARAFQTGSQLARYRADWGQYHADDYWDSDYNMRGFAFYEKAEHGSDRMPQPTHSWSEGLWLYWAMTGDESVHASAVEAADAAAKIVDYGYMPSNALYNNESRWIGWPAFNLIAAYRYTGDARYLSQCQKAVYMLVQAEEDAGRKGYYLSPASPDTRPWMWAGYSALGAIEYYRETGDQRTADYLVRQAEWLLGKRGDYPVLVGGTNVNGQYQPFAIPYSWAPGKPADTPNVELGQMVLPTMTVAARITGRADFRDAARRLFRDVAFYRDFGDGPLDPATRAPISFRSHQYGATSPKVYGHTGLVFSDYIPDLIGALVKPGQTTPPPNVTPTPTPTPTPNPMPTPQPPANPGKKPLSDFDGDGKSDVAIYRPSAGTWQVTNSSTGQTTTIQLGQSGDIPVAADFDGDGKADVAVWRPGNATWYVRNSSTGAVTTQVWGLPGDVPVVGDFDGDGKADYAVWRPSTGQWWIRSSSTGQQLNPALGAQGDIPVVADYDGDGKADLAVFTPGSRQWTILNSASGTRSSWVWGEAGDIPAAGDFDGDGKADCGVWRPSNGYWYVRTATGGQIYAQWGQQGDAPVLSDYDGDGKADYAIWRAASGEWWTISSATGKWLNPILGAQGDVPVKAAYWTNFGTAPTPTPTPTPTPAPAPVVTLLTPTAGTPLIIGQPVRLSWSLNMGAVATRFQLRLSTDGGANYATLIAEVPGSATEYNWTIPSTYSNQRAAQVRFQVVAIDALSRTGTSASPSNLRFAGLLAAVNAASYKTALAPGALVSAFGTVMATQANGQPDSQYVIKGTRVDLVDGAGKSTPCPLFYAGNVPGGGYDQVNFYLPETVAVGQATITVTSGTGEISQSVVTLDQVAPAVFTTSANGAGEAATLSTTDGINYFNGVKQVPNADVYVSMFGTGWRFANLAAGLAAPGSPLPLNYETAAAPVVVEVNGSPVEVTYAGPQMTFLGLDQINFKLPRTLAAGTYSLVVKIGTRVSSTVQLRVQ